MESKTKKSPAKFVGAGIGGVAVIVALFVPLIPISAQESYTEMETRQESYTATETRREAYQEIETQRESLVSGSDYTLEGGRYVYWSAYIESGHRVEFNVRASDTVDTYVLTSSEFQQYRSGDNSNSVAQRLDTESTRYGFTAPIDDTYYFVIYNHHDGFFGLGAKNVGIYSVTATASWEETVTKYRNVEVPVTKYRDVQVPVTKTKTVSNTVSVLELIQRR